MATMVGILSDSHGQVERTRQAIALLEKCLKLIEQAP